MKTTLKILIFSLLVCFTFQSCSKDDNEEPSSTLDRRFAKKWYIGTQFIELTEGEMCENNYYDLKSNGDVVYKHRARFGCEHIISNGEWHTENNVLYRNFPSVGIVLLDSIIRVSNTELVLKDLDNDRINIYYNYD